MTAFNRTLVAMDLSVMDPKLLEWVGTLDKKLGFEKVYFVHIMPDFSAPKNVDIEFHVLFSTDYPADEKVRDRIIEDLEKILGNRPKLDLAVEVHEGKPYQKLIQLIDHKDIGLLIIGRKKLSEGSGISARRITRSAKCNVLIIPETSLLQFQHIIVPVDFSDLSAKALRTALDLAQKHPELKITALYVMDLPPVSYYDRPYAITGLQQMLHNAAWETFEKFIAGLHVELPQNFQKVIIDNTSNNTGRYIVEYADAHAADLLIMGAQGHSQWENLWFGSVTEKVADSANCPVLVVR